MMTPAHLPKKKERKKKQPTKERINENTKNKERKACFHVGINWMPEFQGLGA